jgi:hypothetical protein
MKAELREVLFFFNCKLPGRLFQRHAIVRVCDWLEFSPFWGDAVPPTIQESFAVNLDALAADPAVQAEIVAIQTEFAPAEGDGLEALPEHVTQATAEKISQFANLPFGWHYGFGLPPDTETIHRALLVEAALREASFQETNAFPGLDGEIQVTGYHEALCVELTVEPNSRVTFVAQQAQQEIAHEDLTYAQALKRIEAWKLGVEV